MIFNISSKGQAPHEEAFRRILVRNVSLPLIVTVLTTAVYIGLVFYLLSVSRLTDHSNRVIATVSQLEKVTIDGETGMRGFLLAGRDSFLEPYNANRTSFPRLLNDLRELTADNPGQQLRLDRIDTLYKQWTSYAEDVIALRRADQPLGDAVGSERGKRLMDELRREFAGTMTSEETLRGQRQEAASTTSGVLVAVTAILGVVAGLGLALQGRRQLTNLATVFGDALGAQQRQNAALTRQDWLKTGQANLAAAMLGEQTLVALSRSVLGSLCRYLDAPLGVLHVSRDGHLFNRAAEYGVPSEGSSLVANFEAPRGIAGQAVEDKRVLALDHLPADYMQLVTGLGATALKTVLLIPVSSGHATTALIELGFRETPDEDKRELIELLRDAIARSLETALYRERLQETLAEAQRLNEELQVQQEELRVSNEELEERGRALQESHSRLQNQQAELEQINVQLEERTQDLVLQQQELLVAQGELSENAAQLERTSQYKSEFLANMSHELRTPLNSSLILARLLADNKGGRLSEEEVRYAGTIHSANTDLLNLINDILDLSKVEAGQMRVNYEDVPAERIMLSLENTFRPIANQKQLALRIEREPGAPAELHIDEQRLEQILKNLLSNALKFTDSGEVSLRLLRGEHDTLRFEVRDTGIGVPKDKLEMIFGAFQQVDGTVSRRHGGSGLGLSISRELARLMQGTVSVASEVGKGSLFTLTLPLHPQQAVQVASPASAPHAATPLRRQAPAAAAPLPQADATAPDPIADDRQDYRGGRLILAIEDDPKFAGILYELAHDLDFDCVHATSAAEGMALARKLQPAGVLLDVGLPDQSGLTLLEWLKNDPLTRHIPVHMVSATDHVETALHLGAVGYTLKPTVRDDLVIALRKLEARLAQGLRRVLVVEDDPAMCQSIRALLASDQVEIHTVGSIAEASHWVESETVDCMVMDLTLPDGSGFELLERLAREQASPLPPIIVYTGRALSASEEQQLRRYSKSIIIKGARSPERLLDEVTLFLHSVESGLPPAQQRMLKASRSRDAVFEGSTILLVEDDVRNVFALTHVIEPLGARVLIARNGHEALDLLERNPEVDLVLMDLMMPEMDGLTATRTLRQRPECARLPVIALTAKAMPEDRQRCLEAGANDYIAKPIDVDKLVSLCRVWLRQA
ncbi:response regulator [Niveibacterium sp. SC-1]|uniref:response regulator n=1 Tax=Niveibacterium sp. SC-1 TaxID=3135646 RepID=UPI00311E6839